jgi:hypothetical protein
MDILDIFLNKIAYKFPKGYPDMNNEQDILILESVIENMDLQEIFKQLSFFDLKKRGGYRFKDLASRIKNKIPFELTNGSSTALEFAKPEYQEAFEKSEEVKIRLFSPKDINSFPFFKDDAGKEYSISDLLKDPYFGGKGKGSGTKVEDYNLRLLQEKIQSRIEQNAGEPINIIIGGKTYYNIIGATTQPKTPKADFFLYDKDNNPQVFISHKKSGGLEPSAGDFIRWSGFTKYENEPEVEEFTLKLKEFLSSKGLEGIPNTTKFISPVKDENLIRKLIYGPEYGSNSYNPENVNIIAQGEIQLIPQGENLYNLTAPYYLIPPEIPQDEYYPYFVSGYRHDRNMFGIKHNEAIVQTKKIAISATHIYELIDGEFIKIK